jgi:hypothetical protein
VFPHGVLGCLVDFDVLYLFRTLVQNGTKLSARVFASLGGDAWQRHDCASFGGCADVLASRCTHPGHSDLFHGWQQQRRCCSYLPRS